MADEVTQSRKPSANFELLSQRVTNLDQQFTQRANSLDSQLNDVKSSVTALGNSFTSALSAQGRELSAEIRGLSNEFRQQTKTPWPVIWTAAGVCFSILLGIGLLIFQPVKDNQFRAEETVQRLIDLQEKDAQKFFDLSKEVSQNFISKTEYDYRADHAIAEQKRVDEQLRVLNDFKIARPEYLKDLLNMESRFDELRADFGELRKEFLMYRTRQISPQ